MSLFVDAIDTDTVTFTVIGIVFVTVIVTDVVIVIDTGSYSLLLLFIVNCLLLIVY